MGKVIVTDTNLTNIANAIRAKNGTQNTYTPAQMAAAITAIPTGGGTLKKGVIRPDAELVQSYTYDKLLHDDEGITIPAYSTTAATLKAKENFTALSVDFSTYDYFMTAKVLMNPVYSNTSAIKGRFEWYAYETSYEFCRNNANVWYALTNSSKSYGTATQEALVTASKYYIMYWNSTTGVTITVTTAGTYASLSAPTVTASAITVSSPAWMIKGNTSYFTSTAWSYMTDIRAQYVLKVWRVPKTNTIMGWSGTSLMQSIQADIHSNNGTLT